VTISVSPPPLPSPLQDGFVRICALISAGGILTFALWAGLVPLDEGISASGSIVVENSRRVVQHLEGGIIAELNVREGQKVSAGETLLVIEDVASKASRDQVLQTIAGLRASEERLLALRDGRAPDFETLNALDLAEADRADIIERQQSLFREGQAALNAERSVLEARRLGAVERAELLGEQIRVSIRALEATRAQLATTRDMFAQQMVRLDQLRQLERDVSGLEADIIRLQTDKAGSLSLATDLKGQIEQLNSMSARQIAEELVDVRARLLSADEELIAAQDVLDRAVLVSPMDAEVLNLNYRSAGGVVRGGEPILELVPESLGVVATVRVQPADRARVFEGQRVRAQVQAFKGWDSPRLEGNVIDVSADLKTDQMTGQSYYEVRIEIPDEALGAAVGKQILPGMPLTAFIFSGNRRTTMEYLLQPISESLFRGLRTS
jgi:HlyD family type I secretion membrane fusion protein